MEKVIIILCVLLLIVAFVIVYFRLLFERDDIQEQLDDTNDWIDRVGCLSNSKANIDLYQQKAQATNKYEPGFEKRVCCALGVASEAGEVAGKVDKCIRKNHNTNFTDEQKRDIALEIGDVMWFAAGLAYELGYKMSDICQMNLEKLASRDQRNVICGSGDHR